MAFAPRTITTALTNQPAHPIEVRVHRNGAAGSATLLSPGVARLLHQELGKRLDQAGVPRLPDEPGTPVAAEPETPEEPQSYASGMQVHVTSHRWANMGDHAVQALTALTYDPTETAEALVLRALELLSTYGRHDPMDFVTLRVVQGTEPERPKPFGPPF